MQMQGQRNSPLDHGSIASREPNQAAPSPSASSDAQLDVMPNEILFHIFTYLDVDDLLSTSRTNHHLRHLSQSPTLHVKRIQSVPAILAMRLNSRPPLSDLISRSIFLTNTSVVSRRLARSLVCIRLSRNLAARPSAQHLVERSVLPPECVPGMTGVRVSPGLVARTRAVEKEITKDGLRKWVGAVWKKKVTQREEGIRRWEESRGIGRVWRLRKFWERVGRGERGGRREAGEGV